MNRKLDFKSVAGIVGTGILKPITPEGDMGTVVLFKSKSSGEYAPKTSVAEVAGPKRKDGTNSMGLPPVRLDGASDYEKDIITRDFFFLAENPEIASRLTYFMDRLRKWLSETSYLARISDDVEVVQGHLRFSGVAVYAVPILGTVEADWEQRKPYFAAIFLEYRKRTLCFFR
jgi:hypothetical protein